MKYILLTIVLALFCSCSSDSETPQLYIPPQDNSLSTKPQDLYGTMWFFDKEVYILTNGDEIEILPEQCRSESWFEIGTDLVTGNHNLTNDGNGNCINDFTINDAYTLVYISDGYFTIRHHDFTNSTHEDRDYEIILENNGVYDEPQPFDIMIWLDDSPEELYQGQSLSSKQSIFKRRLF